MEKLSTQNQLKLAKYLVDITEVHKMMDIHKLNMIQDCNFEPYLLFEKLSSAAYERQRYIDAQRLYTFLLQYDIKVTIDQWISFIARHNEHRKASLIYEDFLKFVTPKLDHLLELKGSKKEIEFSQLSEKATFSLATTISREIEAFDELNVKKETLYWGKSFDTNLAYKSIDIEGGGFIDHISITKFLKKHKQYLMEDDLNWVISEIGNDAEWVITYAEFMNYFKNGQHIEKSRSPSLRRKFVSPPSKKSYQINPFKFENLDSGSKSCFHGRLATTRPIFKTLDDRKWEIEYSTSDFVKGVSQGLPDKYTAHTPRSHNSDSDDGFSRWAHSRNSKSRNDTQTLVKKASTQSRPLNSRSQKSSTKSSVKSSVKLKSSWKPRKRIVTRKHAKKPTKVQEYRETYSSFLRKKSQTMKNPAMSQEEVLEDIPRKTKAVGNMDPALKTLIDFLYKVLCYEKRTEAAKIELSMKPDFTCEGAFALLEYDNCGFVSGWLIFRCTIMTSTPWLHYKGSTLMS